MRLAVDTGGTFTDFVVFDGEACLRFKLPSTPADPARALLAGCSRYSAFELAHGTTVATNAILEGKTARTGLVTNEGFRDFLRLGRQSRPSLYDWQPKPPRLPVLEEDVRTVAIRIEPNGAWSGEVPGDIDLGACEAVAVCLLYGYAAPEAERAVAAGLSGYVSLSHEVSPEMREYERACATVLNAAVAPILVPYLQRLQESTSRVGIMASHGGLVSLDDAAALPIRTVVSGPAGGVAAAIALGKRLDRPNTIAFDMGGTSTDVTLIRGHEAAMTACEDIAGLPVRLRRIDVHTIGCGGGSIAYVDAAGALRVGPQSAGADPGPALFGGDKPTVTDANFVLGRLPVARLARQDGVDPKNAEQRVNELAQQLNLDLEETATAIIAYADSQMAAAVRKVSADRGLDPAGFSLTAFGGAGALHACAVADLLNIREILVPVGAGVFSALGILSAPEVWEASRGVLGTEADWSRTYAELEGQARAHTGPDSTTSRLADMRYQGQSHDLTVGVDGSRQDAEADFHSRHSEVFGTSFANTPVHWVTARVRAERGRGEMPVLMPTDRQREPAHGAGTVDREEVERVAGPIVIVDDDCTIFVPGHWAANRLEDGTLSVRREA